MDHLFTYRNALTDYLEHAVARKHPEQLYAPIRYILSLGGKRLRPVLTLMTADFFSGSYQKAMHAALAIELFHNFSLMHDDIMDNASLRRGKKTVHKKWGLNTGILSGDAMLILAYQLFENYDAEMFRQLAGLFSKTALKVCEGQQCDVDFETRTDVTLADYIKMIDHKTAVLIGSAIQMGAMIAGAAKPCWENSYEFGRNLGIAFQLQDDYLDVFGNPETFGKQTGGDIISNKKTFLYLTAVANGSKEEAGTLRSLFRSTPKDPSQKIETVKNIFTNSGAAHATVKEIENYTQKANTFLGNINIAEEKKEKFCEFGEWLIKRTV